MIKPKSEANRLVLYEGFPLMGGQRRTFRPGQRLNFALRASVHYCVDSEDYRLWCLRRNDFYDVNGHIETYTRKETDELDLQLTVFDFGEPAFTTDPLWDNGVSRPWYWFSARIALSMHEKYPGDYYEKIIPDYERMFSIWEIQRVYRYKIRNESQWLEGSPGGNEHEEVPELTVGSIWDDLDEHLQPIPDALPTSCLLECRRVSKPNPKFMTQLKLYLSGISGKISSVL